LPFITLLNVASAEGLLVGLHILLCANFLALSLRNKKLGCTSRQLQSCNASSKNNLSADTVWFKELLALACPFLEIKAVSFRLKYFLCPFTWNSAGIPKEHEIILRCRRIQRNKFSFFSVTYLKEMRFEVLRAVAFILWDIAPFSPVKVYQCFGGICDFHFQGRRIRQARKQPLSL
jgi:hypothetical protein